MTRKTIQLSVLSLMVLVVVMAGHVMPGLTTVKHTTAAGRN